MASERTGAEVFKSIEKRIDKTLTKAYKKSNLKELGDDLVKTIVERTLRGFGSDGRVQKKLDPLSKSYKDTREGKVRFFRKKGVKKAIPIKNPGRPPNLSPKASPPTKSMATATGQMLESIYADIKNNRIFLKFKGGRSKELWKNTSNKTNKEVARHYQRDRPFLKPTERERIKTARELKKKILKEFRSEF